MTDNKDKQESHLTRRQFIIYSSAASAVAAGVI